MDLRVTPVAHEDLKAVLEAAISENWLSKPLAKLLLEEMAVLPGDDRGAWLLHKLDEYQMFLDIPRVRFFADSDAFKKIGLKIQPGAATKKLWKETER